jgi:uncharacterized protein YqjF (DUF2071 family)
MTTFDISPTERLSGLHLHGTVIRRFLINYPVEPDALKRYVPPGAELSTWAGFAWVSACFVKIKRMRPSPVPGALGGIEFNYLIHRTRARLPYSDGKTRESVLVLEPNINRKFFSYIGRRAPGVNFIPRDIALTAAADSYRITMKEESGALLYDAELPRSSFKKQLPNGSRFTSLEQADRFLLGVSYGGEWQAESRRLRLFAETHDPWEALAGTCQTRCNAFLEGLGQRSQADHVITMSHIPHYFALFGSDVAL